MRKAVCLFARCQGHHGEGLLADPDGQDVHSTSTSFHPSYIFRSMLIMRNVVTTTPGIEPAFVASATDDRLNPPVLIRAV